MRFLFALSLLLSGCFLASAQLALCGESVDFGIIREADGMKTATAYVKNVSESPVFLLKVKPTCGCTAADFPRESILPGDSACITLTYNPLRRPGRFDKEVKVFPSDGEMIRIPIHGTVIASESTLNQLYPDKAGPLQSPYYRIDISEVNPANEWTAGNYFHKDNFIIFDLAVGGNFTGIHNANEITALNDANGQEASMYINYVKIYQKGVGNESFYSAVPGDQEKGSGLEDAFAEEIEGSAVEVFNLGGVKVLQRDSADDNILDTLPEGIYIVKSGNKTKKIIKR